jgi:hypothetical protein
MGANALLTHEFLLANLADQFTTSGHEVPCSGIDDGITSVGEPALRVLDIQAFRIPGSSRLYGQTASILKMLQKCHKNAP